MLERGWVNENGTRVHTATEVAQDEVGCFAEEGLHGFGVYPGVVGKRVRQATQTNQERSIGHESTKPSNQPTPGGFVLGCL